MNKSLVLLVVFILPIICCQSRLTETTMEKDHPANRLIHTTSPYLQQHAYNPVDWYPWGEEALTKAKEEDKMILVSIGYSSCHWCHVMERETFENDSIAAVMNASFINIKVDREERPDIDQIYMDAVQAMGINGGWPLNVFLTPDQKPFYGGTYFPPDNWVKMLQSLSLAFRDKREEIENSANSLVENLTISERKKFGLEMDTNPYDISLLDQAIEKFRSVFDKERGGFNRAPKFPLPSNWQFLLRYASSNEGEGLMAQSLLTLDRIQQGGIYDHLGGGFARYSTDARWFAPHFEKMLYDNGQLLSLYSEAYMISGKESYRQTVYETIDWIEREMMDEDGAFYSAIDADSEGEEGKFYVWKASALREFLGEDYSQFAKFYGVKEDGNWESGNNILFRSSEEAEFALKNGLDIGSFKLKLKEIRTTLLQIRNNRIKPATDTKVLSGWNALALKGLLDAYNAFGERRFLDMALKNAEFIQEKMIQNGQLMRSYKDGISNIAGYLEDYAFTISAFHSLYEATFNEKWLTTAENLLTYTLDNFLDKEENLFYFTSNKAEELIARKKDIFDNVIPSSNSQMALNLHMMGLLLDKSDYLDLSDKMLRQVTTLMAQYPGELSNWASLYTHKSDPTAEIVIVGEKMEEFRKELSSHFLPNKVIMGTLASSELPLFENRSATKGETTVYVCYNKTCKLPVNSVEATLKLLEE